MLPVLIAVSLLDSVETASEPDVTASSNQVQSNTDCKFNVVAVI